MKLFVGIDVSSQDMKACIMTPDGDTLSSPTVQNNLVGASFLRDQILHFANKLSSQNIEIGLESTSVYSWHPAMFFMKIRTYKAFIPKCIPSIQSLLKSLKKPMS